MFNVCYVIVCDQYYSNSIVLSVFVSLSRILSNWETKKLATENPRTGVFRHCDYCLLVFEA